MIPASGTFTLLISVGCPSDGGHRGRWSNPRPPQAEPGIVTLSPVLEPLTSPSGTTQADRRWSAFSATDRQRSSIISSIAGSFRICSARSSVCWYQPAITRITPS